MGRRIAIIVLLLLGGALVNVAVAWGCALSATYTTSVQAAANFASSRPGGSGEYDVSRLHLWWRANAPSAITHPPVSASVLRSFGTEYVRGKTVNDTRSIRPHVFTLRRGRFSWPLPSMEWSVWRARGIRAQTRGMLRTEKYDFPLRPIWPGFAVNTFFYAAILWLLIRGPFALRQVLRRRRGLCVRCGYPMGAFERCTECGVALVTSGAHR